MLGFNHEFLAALLLKLEKRIAEIPIESRDLGFTKPGPYIFELLAELNITYKTATMLIGTIEEAALLLEEGKLQTIVALTLEISPLSRVIVMKSFFVGEILFC